MNVSKSTRVHDAVPKQFLSDEGPLLETLDYTIRIGSTPTFLYFDLHLYSTYAAHFVYFTFVKTADYLRVCGHGYSQSNNGDHRCVLLFILGNFKTKVFFMQNKENE